jgi:hypothetical protein
MMIVKIVFFVVVVGGLSLIVGLVLGQMFAAMEDRDRKDASDRH